MGYGTVKKIEEMLIALEKMLLDSAVNQSQAIKMSKFIFSFVSYNIYEGILLYHSFL